MALSKRQQRILEDLVNALVIVDEGTQNVRYWTGIAKGKAVELIPEAQRILDPMPFRHRAYGDRAIVPLSSFVFSPRPAYVQERSRYPKYPYEEG